MDDAARGHPWTALRIDVDHGAKDTPARDTPDGEDLLWNELLDAARGDGNRLSLFVVNDSDASRSLYVSPDWPAPRITPKPASPPHSECALAGR